MWLYDLFLGLSVFGGSFCFSMILVSKYIWLPMVRHGSVDAKLYGALEAEMMYLTAYDESFEQAPVVAENAWTDEQKRALSKSIQYETTPRGNVLFFYDAELDEFCYYADIKDIPYKYLETIAKKYIVKNKCKHLYVCAVQKRMSELASSSLKSKTTPTLANVSDNKHILQFRYMGKVSAFSFLQKIDLKKVVKKRALTYLEYKQWLSAGGANVNVDSAILSTTTK